MSVYFAYSARGNLVKIGFSAVSPETRVRAFNGHTGLRAKLVAVLPGPHSEEQAMHKRFGAVKIGYECFRLEGELLSFLISIPGALSALRRAKAHTSATVFLNGTAVDVANGRYRRRCEDGYKPRTFPPEKPRVRRALFSRLQRAAIQAQRDRDLELQRVSFLKYRHELSQPPMGI